MSLPVRVESYTGSTLKINGEGEASVVVHPHPPKDEEGVAVPFIQSLTADGTSTGSVDMRVDGSTNAQEFYVSADQTKDTYIKTVQFTIADATATLNKFGNLTALTNGCAFEWDTQEFGTVTIKSGLKSNWDFVKMARGQPAFGDGASAFQAGNVVSTSEAYVPVVDMSYLFGIPWGLRLRAGTKDRLVLKVNDDISTPSVDEFTSEVSGIRF
jgi:hypothetical protein